MSNDMNQHLDHHAVMHIAGMHEMMQHNGFEKHHEELSLTVESEHLWEMHEFCERMIGFEEEHKQE